MLTHAARILFLLVTCHSSLVTVLSAQGIITTVAGTTWAFRGEGGPATSAPLGQVEGVAVDSAGNVYVADAGNFRVMKISPDGTLTVVAGNGSSVFAGDGGPATSASLRRPMAVALDAAGNLYIVDIDSPRIRKVSPNGIITTVAGNGTGGFSGDGGPALNASLRNPLGVATDGAGNLYIADSSNHRIRKVDPGGIITTVAGNGTAGFSGDGGPATNASLNFPSGVAVDADGDLYIADTNNRRVRKVPRGGVITTVAGTGVCCFSGDAGPAVSAQLQNPWGVAVDASGNLYIADYGSRRIRKVSASGVITTVAGNGNWGFSGDGGLATRATFSLPRGVAVDAAGYLYIADELNYRIRRVAPNGLITTFAGNGLYKLSTDGDQAANSLLNLGTLYQQQGAVAVDGQGSIYIAEVGTQRVRKVSLDGKLTTVAGNGTTGFSGDGGLATLASLNLTYSGQAIAVDAVGNLYIADDTNSRIRKVSPGGQIATIAGNGNFGFSGDGGPASSAVLSSPTGVAVDVTGNLYIADTNNHSIRKVSPNGTITTVAGNRTAGFSGDGGPAVNASLRSPQGLASDRAGNLYIADTNNHSIRKVSPNGTITTVAGTGVAGFSGNGVSATSAMLNSPRGLAVDSQGNLYIADLNNNRIRKVSPDGIITTVAGTGGFGYSGDGGLATSALLAWPLGIALDATGNLYIADARNDRIRKVLVTAPSFSVTPATLSFSAPAGTAVIPAKPITTTSEVTGLLWRTEVSTEDGAPWLTFAPPIGLIPAPVAVSVNAARLAPGTYRGTVTMQAPLAVTPTNNVAVQFIVTSPLPPQLSIEPSSLNFQGVAGTGNPPAQTLRISNAGGGSINWTARATTAAGGNWLSVSQASGTAASSSPVTVQVNVNTAGLDAGVYSGEVRVDSSTTGQVQTLPVNLVLAQPTATVLVSQTGLLFTGVEGGGIVPSQSFGILNVGQGVMNWAAEATTLAGGNWLSVSPGSGSSTENSLEIPLVDGSANVAGLRAGAYSGLIRISSGQANNSPQSVTVVLNVLPADSNPGILVRPTGLIFATVAGGSSPAALPVGLATAAAGNLGFVTGLLTFDGRTWLEAGTRNAILSAGNPATVSVQPALGSLGAGIYRGTLTLLFSDGNSQTVNILFVVVPSARAVTEGASKAADPTPQCTPQQLLGVHRTLGANVGSPVGWPTNIEVQLVDDCGNAVSNAAVLASFSNGDPPLVFNSLGSGLYTGTWRPVNPAAQVVVSVQASLPSLAPAILPAVQSQVTTNPNASALYAGGIVSAASFASREALAPGSIVSVFGRNLAQGQSYSTRLPLEKTLGGATLNIGGIEAPLFFSSDGQINAQLPFELAPNSRPHVVLRTIRATDGGQSLTMPETITVADARPAIFTTNQQGTGQGAILNQNFSPNSTTNPAARGSVIQIFATGLGITDPVVASGQPAPAQPVARVKVPVVARIAGLPATVQFAGLAPGFVGLYQVNVEIPAGVAPGAEVPLVLLQNGVPSSTVTLAVR